MRRLRRSSLFGGDTPVVEVFGAAFALLLILFLLINLFAEQQLRAQVENTLEESVYKINWEQGAEGYIVLAFRDRMQIIEDKRISTYAEIKESCPTSAFADYARKVYDGQSTQIIFAIVDGGVRTMKAARDCLMNMWPERRISIGWIIANDDFMQAVNLQDLPPRIKRSLTN